MIHTSNIFAYLALFRMSFLICSLFHLLVWSFNCPFVMSQTIAATRFLAMFVCSHYSLNPQLFASLRSQQLSESEANENYQRTSEHRICLHEEVCTILNVIQAFCRVLVKHELE